MTDFLFNHFQRVMDKAVDRLLVTSYERMLILAARAGKN